MDKWTLRRPVWIRFLLSLPFTLFSAAICLICTNLAYVFVTKYAFDAGMNLLYFILALLIFLFAVLFAFICFLITQDSFSQVLFSSQGIEQRRFGKCLCSLSWDELAEAGIALEKWTTRSGPKRCLYFADRQLDEFERAVIDESLDRPKSGKLIRAACHGIQNEDMLRTYCPVPIPAVQDPKNGKYHLLSYRRNRKADGSWEDAETSSLPDARMIVSRFRSLQQEASRKRSF